MYHRNSWRYLAAVGVLALISTWLFTDSFAGNEQMYAKLDKGLFHLKQVYETISRSYVDEVDPEALSKSAIEGIVSELDPYTVYFEQGRERLEIITKGTYGGVGMEIGKREDKITVIAPIDDTPAQRAGVRAGDIILKIDDESTSEMSLEDASDKLRGTPGSEVKLELKRPGIKDSLKLTLIRQDIVLKDVSYAGFLEPGTAIFRLTSFSDKAASELEDAIKELQKEGKIERVVLDLRGNPGGLLASAVEVSNIFLPKGEMVVSTRGTHEREAEYRTGESPLLPDVPLVVLVNGGSASASEIVAGAMQDLDRGIIIGTPTFGKGLVQQVYPVDKLNDAFLKITTAKYYVPSGRSIQKEDYKKNKEVFTDLSDSTEYDNHIVYHTRNGRKVYGGGGIKPDIEVENDQADQFILALWAKGYFFRFTVDYLAEHPELKDNPQIKLDEQTMQAFRDFLISHDLDFEVEGEAELKGFLEIAGEQNYSEDIADLVEVAIQKLEQVKKRKFDEDREKIRHTLEAEFAEKIGGSSARIAAQFRYDPVIKKAEEVLQQRADYQKILAVQK
ncbi:MAG: S41 family peptidase [Calditrichia bacterium]